MAEDNGNIGYMKPTLSSTEDLSEYTDADESISAPTEFLAEFLSAVMLKDYGTALKYCKLILQYEPNNATAKEFYPLIIEKLQLITSEDDIDIESEDDDASSDDNSSSSSSSESDSSSSDDNSDEQEDENVEEVADDVRAENKHSKGSSNGDNTTGSYSSLEDDEAELDQLAALAVKYKVDNVDLGNGNKFYETNTMNNSKLANNCRTATGYKVENKFGISSDSESPTDPVSQQTIAMLRARIIPN